MTIIDINPKEEIILAERSQRFFAFLIDLIFSAIVSTLIGAILGLIFNNSSTSTIVAIASISIICLIQGKLLLSNGQTIGKKLLSIRILDSTTLEIPSLYQILIKRYLLFWQLPNILAIFILPDAGAVANLTSSADISDGARLISILGFIVLAQCLLIFRSDRRCGHDLLSRTVVEKINIPIFNN
jgi:uncharacterized RDD family membrane protein YckC